MLAEKFTECSSLSALFGTPLWRRILAVLLGLTVVLSGCRKREANEYNAPEAALIAMFAAFESASADPQGAWSFLGPDTRRRLESIVASSGLDVEPISLVEFGWVPDEALIQNVERVSSTGNVSLLEVTTELGDTFEVELYRQERGWTVELGEAAGSGIPLPSSASSGETPEASEQAEGEAVEDDAQNEPTQESDEGVAEDAQ